MLVVCVSMVLEVPSNRWSRTGGISEVESLYFVTNAVSTKQWEEPQSISAKKERGVSGIIGAETSIVKDSESERAEALRRTSHAWIGSTQPSVRARSEGLRIIFLSPKIREPWQLGPWPLPHWTRISDIPSRYVRHLRKTGRGC